MEKPKQFDMNDTNAETTASYNTEPLLDLSSVSQRIAWGTYDGRNGDTTLRQHAFIDVVRTKPWIGDKYIGAKSLCGKIGISEDGENYLPVSELADEKISSKCCKTCLKIYKAKYGG